MTTSATIDVTRLSHGCTVFLALSHDYHTVFSIITALLAAAVTNCFLHHYRFSPKIINFNPFLDKKKKG